MREAMGGLTTRGRSFLAAAAAAAISALVLGERDLLRVAILLAALPLLAAAYVGRSRYKLACTRSLEPGRAPVGSSARVILRLQNLSRLPTGTLLLEDRLPYALGSRPRVVLERLAAHQASSVAYAVRADVRGRYPVGPLVIRLTDPFGLCELNRSFPSVDRLIVIPQVVPLPAVRLAGEYAGTGDSRTRSVAVHGEDDAATREYRRGDDLRRIHWRSTARRGELMVRREEQPWQNRAAPLVDCRGGGHPGDGPASSLEWAVSAAASVGLHLSRAGFTMRVVGDTGDELTPGVAGTDFADVLLDALSVQGTTTSTTMQAGVTALRRGGGEEMLVAVVGPMTSDDAHILARILHSGPSIGIAFVLDTASWTTLASRAAAAAQEAHDTTCDILAAGGWRVLPVSAGDNLAQIWSASGVGTAAGPARGGGRLSTVASR